MHQQWLSDGQRLHLQEGPIDLVIGMEGTARARRQGFERAVATFNGMLSELVAELPLLRQELNDALNTEANKGVRCELQGVVANRMMGACLPHTDKRITPMAAVAGSVADAICDSIASVQGLNKVWVNNGGDIALYLAPGNEFSCAVAVDPVELMKRQLCGSTTNTSIRCSVLDSQSVRGIATSGRHGRSLSLGIADSVTVLAKNAAAADVAATLIANSVDVPEGHDAFNGITRTAASKLDPDSDLQERLVVTDVPRLDPTTVLDALSNGYRLAQELRQAGTIHSAILCLQGQQIVCTADESLFITEHACTEYASTEPVSFEPAETGQSRIEYSCIEYSCTGNTGTDEIVEDSSSTNIDSREHPDLMQEPEGCASRVAGTSL